MTTSNLFMYNKEGTLFLFLINYLDRFITVRVNIIQIFKLIHPIEYIKDK